MTQQDNTQVSESKGKTRVLDKKGRNARCVYNEGQRRSPVGRASHDGARPTRRPNPVATRSATTVTIRRTRGPSSHRHAQLRRGPRLAFVPGRRPGAPPPASDGQPAPPSRRRRAHWAYLGSCFSPKTLRVGTRAAGFSRVISFTKCFSSVPRSVWYK